MIDTRSTLETAVGLQKSGHLADAERLYRAVLQQEPRHALANHNLGIIAVQLGQSAQALSHFRSALEFDSGVGQFWISYARALHLTGRSREALAIVVDAQRRGFSGTAFDALSTQICASAAPSDPEDHLNLGNALTALGKYDQAIESYRRALMLNPYLIDAHFHLASVLSETGHIADGFRHYMRRAELVHGGGRAAEQKVEPEHKVKHDHEQHAYLACGADDAPGGVLPFRIEDGDRISGPAINPANASPALLEAWLNGQPQFVVLDNFLVLEALEKLRCYCAGSTIWRKVYDAGYVGAAPEDGFASPLLAQIAEEVSSTFPEIFAEHAFRYLGAFKYDSELSTGTNIHADNSAVNVNLYIAPDEANLDPSSGGMDIWDVSMPPDIDMRILNGNETAARDFLRRTNAKVTVIPHRANRAIIFRSDLFHKTSDCRFQEGYLNKRINVSLLFGRRGAPTR